jgi:hypothetical protein
MSAVRVRNIGVLSLVAALTVIAAALFHSIELSAGPALPVQPALTDAALRLALHRVGLDPHRLTAAGLSGTDASHVVQDMSAYLGASPGPGPYDAAAGAARADVRRLERRVRSGQGTAQDLASLESARATRLAAEAAREAALTAMFAAATTSLTQAERQLLSTMRANSAWALPLEFLAISQNEAERVHLRECLANEKIAARNGEPPDAGAQAYLVHVRGELAVATAKANLDTNLPIVETAWEAAVAQEAQ